MAVNEGNKSNTPGTGSTMSDALKRAGADQAQFGSAPRQQQSRRSTGRPAIMDINQRARRPMSRQMTSEQVIGFQKAFAKTLDAGIPSNIRENFAVHAMDSGTNMIALSALLGCYAEVVNGITHVAVFEMIVEASGPRLQPRYVNMGNTPVEIEQVAGDTVNPELWEKTTLFLRDIYGANAQYHYAGALVLPTELNPDEEAFVQKTAYMVTQALFTVMENDVTGVQEPISVSMVEGGANVTASIDYNPPEVFSAVGLPVLSNLAITLRAAMATSNQQSLHEQQLDLTRVDGYIDLIYVKPPQAQWGQQPITQHYYPRYVITQLDSQVDAITLELQLLALSSAVLAGRQMAWSGQFLPRFNTGGVDLRDIGAIGFEVNLTGDPNAVPERIPTKSESFGRRELLNLLGSAIFDAVVYSLDVEEVGPLAWLTQTFIAAANGNQGAYQAIYDAANNLTNGHFGQIWNNGPIAVDDNNRIHLGYYIDANGQKRDIRELNYLGMLNLLGDKDLPSFHEWAATFEESQVPLELRLERRSKILKALVPDVRIKGFARRITFTADFIAALEQAIQNAGLVVRPTNVQILEGQTAQRGAFNAGAFAVSNQVGAGLFSFNQSPYGGFRSGLAQPFYGTRYGQ